MNKYLLCVFLAFILPNFAAEESSGDDVTSLIEGLDAILRSDILTHEKEKAREQFFEDLEKLGENANLVSLTQWSQGGNYFNTAFGQIPEHPQSKLSERLFKMALDIDDFFGIEYWNGNPAVPLAHDYLTKRFVLDLDEETKSGLYGGFVDSEFLAGLRQYFEAIIAAKTESEKSEAEKKTTRFLENYAYRPIREVLEEKAEEQRRQREIIKPEIKNEFSTIEPQEKLDRLSKNDNVNEDDDYQLIHKPTHSQNQKGESQTEIEEKKPSNFLWIIGGLLLLGILALLFKIWKRNSTK